MKCCWPEFSFLGCSFQNAAFFERYAVTGKNAANINVCMMEFKCHLKSHFSHYSQFVINILLAFRAVGQKVKHFFHLDISEQRVSALSFLFWHVFLLFRSNYNNRGKVNVGLRSDLKQLLSQLSPLPSIPVFKQVQHVRLKVFQVSFGTLTCLKRKEALIFSYHMRLSSHKMFLINLHPDLNANSSPSKQDKES